MYEQYFGLTKRPFGAKATGAEVFVGPQTAKTMAGFRKALAVQDAVVTVSGSAGTGKTTLVERALDAIGSKYKTIRVGRMQMNPSDVLESLLIVLGVTDRPSGTIQRFTALRKKLKALQDAETRVFILIEDALRAGAETLAELEALTAADAGDSDGASIVLMGDERLFDFMKDPQLAQLQQRVRQRHRIKPLCAAELRGYMKHSLRLAGGDFDKIFDSRSADLFHELSEGIPRVANNIVDAVLVAAASQGIDQISATMVANVATDEFGLSVENFDFSEPEPEPVAELPAEIEPEPVAEVEPEPEPVAELPAEIEPEPVAELPPELEPEPVAADDRSDQLPEPVIVFADDDGKSPEDSLDIPHLIQDTLPDLAILSARYATLNLDEDTKEPEAGAAESTAQAAIDDIPELQPESVPEPEQAAPAEDIPELPAEPTPVNEPDWEVSSEPEFELVTGVVPALEAEGTTEPAGTAPVADIPELQIEAAPELTPDAISELEPEAAPVAENAPEPDAVAVPEQPAAPEAIVDSQPEAVAEEVPEWERDPTLAQLKPDLDALEQAMAFTHGEPVVKGEEPPVASQDLADKVGDAEELPEIILDKSIETGIENLDLEVPSDILPPTPATKPDPELDRIAADIANAKSLEDIDDIMAETLFGTGISMIAAQITANPPQDDCANDELELVQDPTAAPAAVVEEMPDPVAAKKAAPNYSKISEEISIETRPPVKNTGLDLSASQRLKTVRALNSDLHPSLRDPDQKPGAGIPGASKNNGAPQPIEDQINTSITQTLKALKVPPKALEDEPEEETKKGFFGRFRRS
jgi:type II secretory pathway predicted ATPase ExeA